MLAFSTFKPLLPLPHYLLLSLRITTLSSSVISRHHQHQQRPSDELPNPYDLMKEDPIQVCSDLWVRCFSRPDPLLPFPNLTGFLKKFDLWVLAYQRACAHHTGSFPPKNAIHLPHLRSLLALQRAALSPNYTWGASTHLLLRSPADPPSTRPISRRKFLALLASARPPFQDRVLQELLLLLLEPVFEPRFSPRSHAFRPGRSPHTVLRTIRSNFAGYLWFLKADLSAVSDNFSPDVIISCLEKGVSDRKVLGLIKSALKKPVRTGSLPADEAVDRLTKKRMKRKMLRKSRKKKVLKENDPVGDTWTAIARPGVADLDLVVWELGEMERRVSCTCVKAASVRAWVMGDGGWEVAGEWRRVRSRIDKEWPRPLRSQGGRELLFWEEEGETVVARNLKGRVTRSLGDGASEHDTDFVPYVSTLVHVRRYHSFYCLTFWI